MRPHASSASAFSSQYVIPISRYIAVAVVRCSCACSRLPVRRYSLPRPKWQWATRPAPPISSQLCGQLVEHRLSVPEVGCVETFGEPAVNLGQQAPRVLTLALSLEKTAQAHRCPQLERFRLLSRRQGDGLTKARFGVLLASDIVLQE